MNFKKSYGLFCGILLCSVRLAIAQGGGPPMLTDDPGTPDAGEFEINTSLEGAFSTEQDFSVPLIDVNYGATKRLQLKAEMPYEITIDDDRNVSSDFGAPNIGFKYRFVDEDKHHIAVSIFPQVIFAFKKEILLPVQLQKSIGKCTLGEAIGYFFVQDSSHNLMNGNLVGYEISKKIEMMLEFSLEHNFVPLHQTTAFLNYGFRYHFNETFTLLASFGTQVITPPEESRQYLISFVGLQTVF